MIDPIELKPLSKADQIKVIRLPVGGRKQILFRLTDEHGQPIDLKHEPVTPDADVPSFEPEKPLSPMTATVWLRAVDQYSDATPVFEVDGKIMDCADCTGLVEFTLTAEFTNVCGIFKCEVGRFVNNDILVDTWPVLVAIEPSVFQQLSGNGPLTIPEIRLGIGDLNMGEVNLLDDLEFSDAEILYCIRQVVDIWNEMPPHVGSYTAMSFPYRYHWIRGTMALLYKIAAKKYARNQLNYQAGGVVIDDQNKQREYTAIAEELDKEFREWLMREKIRINIDRAWSSGF